MKRRLVERPMKSAIQRIRERDGTSLGAFYALVADATRPEPKPRRPAWKRYFLDFIWPTL